MGHVIRFWNEAILGDIDWKASPPNSPEDKLRRRHQQAQQRLPRKSMAMPLPSICNTVHHVALGDRDNYLTSLCWVSSTATGQH